jgi:CoA:oxalate CoA-transferase
MRPLADLRVLDLSRALSGPFSGRMLADLGADVVKVEWPGTDIAQAYGKVTGGRSGLWAQLNAGKRAVELDLREPASVQTVLELAAVCDVVIENFRPGVLDRLGLGWEPLRAANPALVLLSISGFGQTGPDSGRQAYAPVIHAESGLIGRQAEVSGGPPEDLALALADSLAGLHGTVAVLAALRLRDRTGAGQHIDISMLESLLATDDYTHYVIDEHPIWAARGETWPAPGGPMLISSDRRHIWRQLALHFGLSDPDPGADPETRFAERARMIAAWTADRPGRDELKRDLERAGLAWAEVRRPEEVLRTPTAGRVVAVVPEGTGERRVVRMPYRFSDADAGPVHGAAAPGEYDAGTVLDEWRAGADRP